MKTIKELEEDWDRIGLDSDEKGYLEALEDMMELIDEIDTFQTGFMRNIDEVAVYKERLKQKILGIEDGHKTNQNRK